MNRTSDDRPPGLEPPLPLAVLDRIGLCAYAVDRGLRVTLLNAAALDHYGLDRAEAIGLPFFGLVPALAGGDFERRLRGVVATGEPDRFDMPSAIHPGAFVRVAIEPLDDGAVVSVENVTPARAVETALVESERRLAIATEAADIGVWDWDLVSGSLTYTDRARAVFGFPESGPVTLEMVRSAIHPEDRERVAATARRALDPALRAREAFEHRVVRPSDGRTRWILSHGEAIFGPEPDATAVRFVGTMQDITERRIAYEAVRASEARLRLAIDAGRMAVWALDLETQTLERSPELNRVLGFPEDAAPTLDEYRAGYFPGERERLQAAAAAALAAGERFFEVEYRYVRPDGDLRWLLLRADIVLGASGAPKDVIGVVIDVTERRRAEERQRVLALELAHRVKNTLAVTQALARQSFRDVGDRKARDAFVGRILALSKAHDAIIDPLGEGVSLDALIATVIEPYRGDAADPITATGPAVVVGASLGLALVLALHELATNAAKYGALSVPEGRVVIDWRVATEDGQCRMLHLDWVERDGPPVRAPDGAGFGTRLIREQLEHGTGGSVALEFRVTGVTCAIEIPLGGAAAPA